MLLFDKTSQEKSGGEDIPAARDYLLDELSKGPFAPALAGECLDRFQIQKRLSDFVREHLADQVTLIGNQAFSPVGRPALALTSRLNDPAYWATYRLSSLFRVWEEAAARIDMSALNRSDVPSSPVTSSRTPSLGGDDLVRQFPVGAQLFGRVSHLSYTGAGLIVDVDGRSHSCFLPVEGIPVADRNRMGSLVGTKARFEVISVLPARKSVLLRLVEKIPSASIPSGDGVQSRDIEARLATLKNLHEKGLIPDASYEMRLSQLLAEI